MLICQLASTPPALSSGCWDLATEVLLAVSAAAAAARTAVVSGQFAAVLLFRRRYHGMLLPVPVSSQLGRISLSLAPVVSWTSAGGGAVGVPAVLAAAAKDPRQLPRRPAAGRVFCG